jgi:hypothetical protein
MVADPSLIIQVPRGSAIERQLRDAPPAPLQEADDVLVQTGPTDAQGVLEAMAGDVVLSIPAPRELVRRAGELTRVLDKGGSGTPVVIVVQAGEQLLEEEAAALISASRRARRPVILRIIRPSER